MNLSEIEIISRAVGVLDTISMWEPMQITKGIASIAGQTAEELASIVQKHIDGGDVQ